MTVLQTIPSTSNPNKTYQIILGGDGVTYCTCVAWKMKKTCKHLVQYQKPMGCNTPLPVKISTKLKNAPIATGFEIRGNMNGIKFPCLVDIKYDGILVFVKWEGTDIRLTTKEGTEFVWKTDQFISSAVFLAEWIHGTGRNGTLYDLMSNRVAPGMPGCSIKIFDVLSIGDKDYSQVKLIDRKKDLLSLIQSSYQVDSVVLENKIEVEAHSKSITNQGYEGCVAKNLNETFATQTWVKLKLQDIVSLRVTKVEATRFEVDHGGVTVGIRLIWPVKVGDVVKIRHNGIQKSGSLRNPVPIK